jgi:hypothetical protein
MKFKSKVASAVALVFLIIVPAFANAATYQFTATSAARGLLGYLEYDSTSFSGSPSFVLNTQLLSVNFVNPISSTVLTTIGPSTFGTYFDYSGGVPFVVGGGGNTGGLGLPDRVFIINTNEIMLGNGTDSPDDFKDVSWVTSTIAPTPTPLPVALPLFATGLGALGLLGWRRKRKQAA